jgi:hypothetical protein
MLEKLDTLIAFAVVMLGVSLIITILTQIISTFLGLRGSNLLWGIETLFDKLAPALKEKGLAPLDLAKEILKDKSISDSTFSRAGEMWLIGGLVAWLSTFWPGSRLIPRWRYSTAMRAEELVRVLNDKIFSLKATGEKAQADQADILIELLKARDPETDRRLEMLNDALREIKLPAAAPATADPDSPSAAKGPNYAVQVDKILQQVTDAAQRSMGKLDTYFNSAMDRVAQRFAVQIRVWTVVFAFLLAFGAHLDSLHMLAQLSSNPETRAALVNMRTDMLGEANTLLAPGTAAAATSEVPISPKILNEALAEMNKSTPSLPKPVPDGITTVKDAAAWLIKQPGVPASAGTDYQKTMIDVLRQHAVKINDSLVNAGVQFVPSPYPGVLKFDGWANFLGILLAAAFLSLGAPFWYNALKNLSNLRSVVANKEQQESSAA